MGTRRRRCPGVPVPSAEARPLRPPRPGPLGPRDSRHRHRSPARPCSGPPRAGTPALTRHPGQVGVRVTEPSGAEEAAEPGALGVPAALHGGPRPPPSPPPATAAKQRRKAPQSAARPPPLCGSPWRRGEARRPPSCCERRPPLGAGPAAPWEPPGVRDGGCGRAEPLPQRRAVPGGRVPAGPGGQGGPAEDERGLRAGTPAEESPARPRQPRRRLPGRAAGGARGQQLRHRRGE